MSDGRMKNLLNNVDDELLERQVEMLMETYDLDIDIESVSKRAHEKLKKERTIMKKRRLFPLIAASMIAVIGVSTVYASDISEFVKSFFNKTEVYSTVVDGEAYYLKDPVTLDDGNTLNSLLYTSDRLEMTLNFPVEEDRIAHLDIKATSPDGTVYIPGGYSAYNGKLELLFWGAEHKNGLKPTDNLTLSIAGKEYDITLDKGMSVAETGELNPAQSGSSYVSVGYRKIENGVQIIPNFVDSELQLSNIGEPVELNIKSSFSNLANNSSILTSTSIFTSNSTITSPLLGYDENGNSYEFKPDENAAISPVTQYLSDAPDGNIKLNIPAIIAKYKKSFDKFNLKIPAVGEVAEINREIDFNLKKMNLKGFERTSETTATMTFDVITDDRPEIMLWMADIYADAVMNGEATWADGKCVLDLSFDEDLDSMDISISWPKFIIYGNWVLDIE